MVVTAVVVARKGSKRIKNKNYHLVGGYMMVERKLLQLKKCEKVDNIILGTDDELFKPFCDIHGIDFYLRPPEYCDEISRTPNDMIKNMLEQFESDYVLWSHVTNPLIRPITYDDAIREFLNDKDGHDSLVSLIGHKGHYWFNNKPLNFSNDGEVHQLAKDLPTVYSQNGGIFIRPHAEMKEDGHFVGKNPKPFIMDSEEGIDIDEQWQLDIAQRAAENPKYKV